MARIRHVALFCKDAEKTAEFYRRLFDLKEVARNEGGAIYLSDGEVNLALIQHGPRLSHEEIGINHCGFQIEDMEAFRVRMKELGINQPLEKPDIPGSYFEYKMKDPDGNTLDVSEEGWAR